MLAACCLYLDVNWITVSLIHKLGYFSKCEGIPDHNFLHYWLCIQGNKQMQRNEYVQTTAKICQYSQGLRKQAEATWQAKRGRFLPLGGRKGEGSWAHNFLRGKIWPPRNLETGVSVSHDDGTSVHVYVLLVKKGHCILREVHSSLTGEALQSPKYNPTLQYRADRLEMQASSTF